jgi:hypothetical protein
MQHQELSFETKEHWEELEMGALLPSSALL